MVHESKEALNIIEDMMELEEQIISTEDADLKTRAMVSSLQLLRGQVYKRQDKEAVRTDLTCVEAMTSLTLEERSLMQTQPRTELSQLVTYLYGSSLKKYSEVKLTSLPLSLDCEMICSCSERRQLMHFLKISISTYLILLPNMTTKKYQILFC